MQHRADRCTGIGDLVTYESRARSGPSCLFVGASTERAAAVASTQSSLLSASKKSEDGPAIRSGVSARRISTSVGGETG